jgi:polar amino acid transport system permease protein
VTVSDAERGALASAWARVVRVAYAFGLWVVRLNRRTPFRVKVGLVWVGIFIVLGFFFWVAHFDTQWMRDNFTYIAKGLQYTLFIALGGIVLAIVLALLGALGRISSNPIAYGISGFYVSFFRGTPLIVQMFLIYLALPQVGINLHDRFPDLFPQTLANQLVLDAAVAGTIALGLNYGAYMTEIFRAGIQSVAAGQGEAADALGMTYRQKMRRVVLPQAFRVIIPPTGNEFIAMLKDTALVSFLGVAVANAEIFRRAVLLGRSDFQNLEALLVAAALYWGLTILFTFFQRRLESRVSRGYVRTAPLHGGDHDLPPELPTGKAGTGGGVG